MKTVLLQYYDYQSKEAQTEHQLFMTQMELKWKADQLDRLHRSMETVFQTIANGGTVRLLYPNGTIVEVAELLPPEPEPEGFLPVEEQQV